MNEWNDKIFLLKDTDFLPLALEVFQFQYKENAVYRAYCDALQVIEKEVDALEKIPFLPIGLFKSHRVVCGNFVPEAIFESSGTTQTMNSRHYVKDISLYRDSFSKCFEIFYGSADHYCILALLPSYLERQHSSLVMMADELIKQSGHAKSGFYLYDHEQLALTLKELEAAGTKTILIGVSFALLDFAENHPMQLRHTIVMETGGMKGRRQEITRAELHAVLTERLGVDKIHSEYGMTELLSQAYSKGNGIFNTPPWMKILLREEDDPLCISTRGKGVINVIDLANIYSCSFIATDDVGKLFEDGSFEMIGRVDHSDIRGCSLMLL
jgi:hypothetical protein